MNNTKTKSALRLLFLVGSSGLEPPTSRLSGVRSNHLSYEPLFTAPFRAVGGDKRDRTADPLLAKQVLSQLSYTPRFRLVLRTPKIKQRLKRTLQVFLPVLTLEF